MTTNSDTLFAMALGLQAPWKIKKVDFLHEAGAAKQLHLHIDFDAGSKFKDEAGVDCPVYDRYERTWQHLNFFEHECLLHCNVPRISASDGKVRSANVPWARAGSGFTLLFEAFALALIEREMPINRVAQILGVNAQRIWTVFGHWVGKARDADDLGAIKRLGVDETSSKKGHNYVTVGVDLDCARVIHVSEGKSKDTLGSIARHLSRKDVCPQQIEQLSMDLSPAFIAGAAKYFQRAQITFDRFHVVKLQSEAMDKVRKDERREHDRLKGHKYTFLKNKANRSPAKQAALQDLITLYPTLGDAYRLKVLFNDLWSMPDKSSANVFLADWCAQVEQAKIPAFQKFANTVRSHWSGIVAFVESNITNAILESINSKIQLAKRRARGYRNATNLINMIYFLCGKLHFTYPRYFT